LQKTRKEKIGCIPKDNKDNYEVVSATWHKQEIIHIQVSIQRLFYYGQMVLESVSAVSGNQISSQFFLTLRVSFMLPVTCFQQFNENRLY
jgi:hypothetical protein